MMVLIVVMTAVLSAQTSGASCAALSKKLAMAPRDEMVTQKLADQTVSVCRADKANKSSEPFHLAAFFYVEHSQFAKAITLFDEALRLEPKRDLVRSEKALALVRLEKFDDALAEAKKVRLRGLWSAGDEHVR